MVNREYRPVNQSNGAGNADERDRTQKEEFWARLAAPPFLLLAAYFVYKSQQQPLVSVIYQYYYHLKGYADGGDDGFYSYRYD